MMVLGEGVTEDLGDAAVDAESEVDSEASENKWENEIQENRKAWDLAVESGAVQYNEEEDIMAILQAQNKAIALKKKQAKQKVKARRSRPKNRRKVWCAWLFALGRIWIMPGTLKQYFESWTNTSARKDERKRWLIGFFAVIWTIWLERNARIFNNQGSSVVKKIINRSFLFSDDWSGGNPFGC
nr:uncharacterized protein LOC114925179 [Arachis hypogaea]